jgi:microcystin-dependent protein
MWSGSIASIPSGWALCDGNNGTPNLQNRFIVGAVQDVSSVPNTTITTSNTVTGGNKDAIVADHNHGAGTLATSSSGLHSHPIAGRDSTAQTGADSASQEFIQHWNNSAAYKLAGISSGPDGLHTHTITGSVGSTGSSGTNANLPPYYALAFIMRTS